MRQTRGTLGDGMMRRTESKGLRQSEVSNPRVRHNPDGKSGAIDLSAAELEKND
jgi:hypothetical protein